MNPNVKVSALLVGVYDGDCKVDRQLVHQVFHKLGWKLFEARDRRRAIECLDSNPVDVVIAQSDTPNWNWKRVLKDLRTRAKPPQLVVTSRRADESLWSEVLNVGGYDVMAEPLDSVEIERVVSSAHRNFHYRPLAAGA